jgi:hypothetical protein
MQRIGKWLIILFSAILLVTGLITFPLPFPIGLPLFILGLTILMRHSSDVKRYLVKLSRRYPLLHRMLDRRNTKSQTGTAKDRLE